MNIKKSREVHVHLPESLSLPEHLAQELIFESTQVSFLFSFFHKNFLIIFSVIQYKGDDR